MRRSPNIILVGPMGAGKSTIGRQLSKELNLEFYDTDEAIEEKAGASASWIYDVEGEDGFRERERRVIEELTELQGIILATGGGAIVLPENRNRLAARGLVVYLRASIEQQMKRTNRDKKRPQIQEIKGSVEEFEKLMLEREPMYREIADIEVSTDGRTVRSVAAEIIRALSGDEA